MRLSRLVTGGLLLAAFPSAAQPASGYATWLRQYKNDFLTDRRSPLRAADTGALRFFPYDARFVLPTRIRKHPHPAVTVMATHSGKTKRFLDYGTVRLRRASAGGNRQTWQLHLYQALDSAGKVARPGEFFLPFTDATNGTDTYGGGRYLDLHLTPDELKGGWLTIDFNRAYNPWCAYKEGYNCPVPPPENRISVPVEAGEKVFAGRAGE